MMDCLQFILHLDHHLANLVAQYGLWIYGLLFLIIFCESGIILTPFLPGESLLFAVGTLAARNVFDIYILLGLLIVAAVLGGLLNYLLGHLVGVKLFKKDNVRFINSKHLQHAHDFYNKHGGKAIVLARVIPIVRTFVPFVAGMVKMNYRSFFIYNLLGGILWIVIFTCGSFYFGNLPIIKDNFTWILLAIITFSCVPILFEVMRQRRQGV
ncbi:DedA family protein [soil metagenome]